MHALFRFKSLRNVKPEKGVAFTEVETDASIAFRHKCGCFVIYVPCLTCIKEKHQKKIKKIKLHVSPGEQFRETEEIFDVEEVTTIPCESVERVAIQYAWSTDSELTLNR